VAPKRGLLFPSRGPAAGAGRLRDRGARPRRSRRAPALGRHLAGSV